MLRELESDSIKFAQFFMIHPLTFTKPIAYMYTCNVVANHLYY